jgi:hypothetical protein
MPPVFITPGMTLKEELILRGVKMTDMVYTFCIYATLALVASVFSDKILFKITPEELEKMSSVKLYMYLLIQFSFMAIIFYIVRNVVELIPSPFNNVAKYDHFRLNELKNGAIFSAVYLFNTSSIRNTMTVLMKRFK